MKLWPSRNSSVVEALRTISAGTEMPATVTVWLVSISLTSGLISRLIRPSLSTVGVKDEADAVFLVVERDRAERAGHRDRNLPAGEEARGIARQRHQIGFRQAAGGALLLERVDRDLRAVVRQLADEKAERRRARQHAAGDHRRNRQLVGQDIGAADGRCAGCWNAPPGCVIGSCEAGSWSRYWPAPIAEHVPLHAELAAGLASSFDEAHLQHRSAAAA